MKNKYGLGLPEKTTKPYAMAWTDDTNAEIELYGDIVSEQPTDWDGNPVDGQFIILSKFLEDFKQVESANHLTVRIHSAGGNAYDAMTIHNRLKSSKADVTVIVDGVAMSGGSLIMCAGDKVQVHPGSLIMIHRCWSWLFGGYNASELRKMADSNDAVDRSQATIYQGKTRLKVDELIEMMDRETYMTGQEALDKGFADELIDGASDDIAASADRRTLFVRNMPVWVSARKEGIPAGLNLPTVNTGENPETNINQPDDTGSLEGGVPMANERQEPQAEVNAAVPAVDTEAIQAAVQAEQQRIREIDEMSALFDSETVNEAKYGEKACTAQEMTYRAALKAAKQGREFMAAAMEDTANSGASNVSAATTGDEPDGKSLTPEQMMAAGRADAKKVKESE